MKTLDMAFCILVTGKTLTLKPEQALAVWEVLQGRKEPANDQQAVFCSNVKRLYLNRANAPNDYLEMYPAQQGSRERELVWYQK